MQLSQTVVTFIIFKKIHTYHWFSENSRFPWRIHYWSHPCPLHASEQRWQVPSNINYKSCAYGLCHVLPSPWGNWSGTASNSAQVELILPVSQPCSMFNKLLYPLASPLSPGTLHERGRSRCIESDGTKLWSLLR